MHLQDRCYVALGLEHPNGRPLVLRHGSGHPLLPHVRTLFRFVRKVNMDMWICYVCMFRDMALSLFYCCLVPLLLVH